MTIKFNKTEAFAEAKKKLSAALSNTEMTETQHAEALAEFFEVLSNEVTNATLQQVNAEMQDRSILQQRGQNVLTSEEKKFFNVAVLEGGFKDESILPVTTQERVFEDLVKEHPLLDALGLQDMGAVTRYITSDPTKAFAWKQIFGDISGQVNAAFTEETVTALKLTAFAVIPNDMLELGPEWIERYVRTLLVETYSVGLEFGFVNGRGSVQNEPVGLTKDVDPATGAVTDKVSSGTLTFAPSDNGLTVVNELYGVMAALSTDADGNNVRVSNRVVMVVNPTSALQVNARNTIQNANGVYVTNLPFNIQVVESEEVAADKAIFFVKGRYLAALAGGYKLKKFDQTLAIEDATLFTIKQHANGKPKDNKAALVYDLAISFTPAP